MVLKRDLHNIDFKEGQVLLVNKPYKWTSFDVVNYFRNFVRRRYGLKKIKIGHAGTLDPLATGLLILCTGKYTKKIEELQALEKEYTGTITIGATTPSFDLETEIDKEFNINIDDSVIFETTKQFIGNVEQKPPVYSAIKIKGKRAYEYARKNEDVVIAPKKVEIKKFDITKVNRVKYIEADFIVTCSKGTYIRSLARDFGSALNSGAHLSSLCRTKIGILTLKDAYSIDELISLILKLNEPDQMS